MFFNNIVDQLEHLPPPGYSYTAQIQKEVRIRIFLEFSSTRLFFFLYKFLERV